MNPAERVFNSKAGAARLTSPMSVAMVRPGASRARTVIRSTSLWTRGSERIDAGSSGGGTMPGRAFTQPRTPRRSNPSAPASRGARAWRDRSLTSRLIATAKERCAASMARGSTRARLSRSVSPPTA